MGIIKKNLIDLDSPLKVVISSSDKPDKSTAKTTDPAIELEYNQKITEADNLVKEAKLEAQRIISNAKREALELTDLAKKEGHKEGYDKGYLEGKIQYEALIQETENLKNNTQLKYKEYLNTAEQDIVEIIMSIAKKFTIDSVNNNKEVVLNLVKQTIESCSKRTNVSLRVAEADYEFIYNNQDKILKDISGIDELNIISDEELQAGSCIVDTDSGSINSSIDIRLNKIEDSLKRILATK
ncbi:hypothetical protein IMX26_00340 [Clostridium sp. 'deep sea']|uniref:FliH/SctL family protein n=1 Tax=Clostridium sp. 'deep sea' TaxID=2779445 RepID=UPI0018968334|nr:FliH/SctL family protein [Clostridium sp. 'deep sea']QOR35324.1 hypothetical protein IMX26_00340 [Clostridium sp. 'deep sea']